MSRRRSLGIQWVSPPYELRLNGKPLLTLVRPIGLSFGLAVAVGTVATPYMATATFAYLLMNIGLLNRNRRVEHAILMNVAIGLDLMLVIILETQRHAVDTALSFKLTPWQQAHIVMSSIATMLYIPILILGWKRFFADNRTKVRVWHRRLGLIAYVCRGIGFILMFSLLFKNVPQ